MVAATIARIGAVAAQNQRKKCKLNAPMVVSMCSEKFDQSKSAPKSTGTSIRTE